MVGLSLCGDNSTTPRHCTKPKRRHVTAAGSRARDQADHAPAGPGSRPISAFTHSTNSRASVRSRARGETIAW